MGLDPHYEIVKDLKGRYRLGWSGEDPVSRRPYILERTEKFILYRTVAHNYAAGLIAEYYPATLVIAELHEGTFENQFTIIERAKITYDRKGRKDAMTQIMNKWKKVKE